MPVVTRELTLGELRSQKPIPSSFRTRSILRLERNERDGGMEWRLSEHELGTELSKSYDDGEVEEILGAYGEHVDAGSLRFVGAFVAGEEVMAGLCIWREESWNDSVWLLDIRVREDSRRQGTGTELLEYLKKLVVERALRGILVETQSNNMPAIKFYRRQGFVTCGFNDHLYTNRDVERDDVGLYLFWEAEG